MGDSVQQTALFSNPVLKDAIALSEHTRLISDIWKEIGPPNDTQSLSNQIPHEHASRKEKDGEPSVQQLPKTVEAMEPPTPNADSFLESPAKEASSRLQKPAPKPATK